MYIRTFYLFMLYQLMLIDFGLNKGAIISSIFALMTLPLSYVLISFERYRVHCWHNEFNQASAVLVCF